MALTDNRLDKSPRPKFNARELFFIAALGSVAAGASMFGATGLFVPSVVAAIGGGGIAFGLTNNIPRNGA